MAHLYICTNEIRANLCILIKEVSQKYSNVLQISICKSKSIIRKRDAVENTKFENKYKYSLVTA